jgi:transposase
MSFREVSVIQVQEVLRRWLRGEGERRIADGAGVDRKTARRYIAAGLDAGLDQTGGEAQLSEELIGQVCEAVRPSRPDGHGQSWRVLLGEQDTIKDWIDHGLTVVKIHELLARRGVEVPYRTLMRFAVERCGAGRRPKATVPVADPKPGIECQVDFGRMGLIPAGERHRVCHALIFTACYSRHCYVYLCFRQTLAEVIAGFEAAWTFFGGVFPIVIPDNMAQIVIEADNVAPRLNDTFLEYAQSRGFEIDPARVRTPTDKPRVERVVPYARGNFFAGEKFTGLTDGQGRADVWAMTKAGMRIHGTTHCRPLEVFRIEELPLLLPLPAQPYDVPTWSEPKVHRDFHVEVQKSLYSVPHTLIGQRLRARADQATVKLYSNGKVIKVHPRMPPGKRSSDSADFPSEKVIYATRDLDHLKRLATEDGEAIGVYAAQILDHPLPWTKMRQVYRLLGLVKKWGAERVEAACQRALEAEAIDVNLISRMLERAKESGSTKEQAGVPARVIAGRFARDPGEFAAHSAPKEAK